MNVTTRTFWALTFLFTNAIVGFSQVATLSSPTRSGDQIQFNLEGDPYRRYVIQGSSNLVDWDLLMISVSSGAIHPLSFAASNEFRFFRSTLYSRQNSLSKAIQLTSSMDLRGYNFSVDSFDSRDPVFSTLGQYDPAKRTDHAELSLDEGLVDSLGVGRALVFGSVVIGPETSLIIGSNGSVGSLAWHNAASKGVQPGTLSTDLNPYFPEVKDPFPAGGYSTPGPREPVTNIVITISPEGIPTTNIFVETYDFVFENGNYRVTNLFGEILVNGNARVHVTDKLLVSGGLDIITIATNASLELYVSAPSAVIGGINNRDRISTNFIYYGMPGNKNISLSVNGLFSGIVYAPQAQVYVGGGGNDTYDFIGAIVADSLLLNGHWNFHYDKALRDIPFPQ